MNAPHNLNRPTEVVVIGGGVEGCSIAYHLARARARVTVLERWKVAGGASGASAGGVRHQQRDFREFALAFRAVERWKTLEAELEADLRYRRLGHLTTIEDESDLPELEQSTAEQAAAGLDIRVVGGNDLTQIAPFISPNVIAAAYTPNDGHANPELTTLAFAAAAKRHGADVREGTAVTGITVAGGRIGGVRTQNGPIAADVVVLAAGAWSVDLAAGIGVHLPLTAHGFQAMLTHPREHRLDQVIGSRRRMISLKQVPDGRYLLGGGWPGQFSLEQPRGESIPESQSGNLAEAIAVFPSVANTTIEHAWLGIEAVAIDEVPIIGPVPGIDGLVIAAGFSGHGFALSPAVGEAVAETILSGALSPALRDLTISRFDSRFVTANTGPTAG